MKKLFKREIYETQVWLMWILAFLLLHFGESTISQGLGWVVLIYSIATAVVTVSMVTKKKHRQGPANELDRGEAQPTLRV